MEIWQLFYLGPFAAAFLLWLIAPVLLLTIPAIIILAIKKHYRKEQITYYAVIKAFVMTVIIQLLIFSGLHTGLPYLLKMNSDYKLNAVCFFSSQVIGFIVMIYLLAHFHATDSPEEAEPEQN